MIPVRLVSHAIIFLRYWFTCLSFPIVSAAGGAGAADWWEKLVIPLLTPAPQAPLAKMSHGYIMIMILIMVLLVPNIFMEMTITLIRLRATCAQ